MAKRGNESSQNGTGGGDILVVRFSALGDVAMTIPPLYDACRQNPGRHFIFLTKPHPAEIFINRPDNLTVLALDADDSRGIRGLLGLFRRLRRDFRIDTFVDLHNVLRTHVLTVLFRFHGVRVATFDKMRARRARLTSRGKKHIVALPAVAERYAETFRNAGIPVTPEFTTILSGVDARGEIDALFGDAPLTSSSRVVAIAPFARHRGKIYPAVQMQKVVDALADDHDNRLLVFGFGGSEAECIEEWRRNRSNIVNLAAANLGIERELRLMTGCDVMLSMDSANMHLAGLVGLPVVTIWGATHPYAGFNGRTADPDLALQLPMTCRPCSIFGNKPCHRGDYHCLRGIPPGLVVDNVMKMKTHKHLFPALLLTLTLLSAPGHSACAADGLPVLGYETTLSATDPGYLARGARMLDDGNPLGTVNQLGRIATEAIPLDDNARQDFLFLLAKASFLSGDPRCETLLREFVDGYAASPDEPEALLLLADYYFFAGDFSAAVETYKCVPDGSLDTATAPRVRYRTALSMLKCGLYNEARPLFASIASDREYSVAAEYYDAYIDYVTGNPDAAYRKFMDVLKAGGRNAEASADGGTGNRAGRKNPPIVARRRYEYETSGMEPRYYICQILLERGEWREVVDMGQAIIRQTPVPELLPDTFRAVGMAFYKLGDYDEAMSYLQTYVRDAGEGASVDARYALGQCYFNEGDYENAREILGPVAEGRDVFAQTALLILGQTAARQNDNPLAVIYFDRAYRMNYDPKVSETALFNYIAASSRGASIPFDSSVGMLKQFAEKYPGSRYSGEVDRALASACYSSGEYEKALGYIDKVDDSDGETTSLRQKILYAAGSAALTAGDNGRARQLLKRGAALAGLRGVEKGVAAETLLWLGDADLRLKDYADAESALRKAIGYGLNANSTALAHYDLGYALLAQDKFSTAADAFSRVVGSPGNLPADIVSDARLRGADCRYYSGRYDEALKEFNDIAGSDSRSADFSTLRRAQIEGLKGRGREKIRILETFETRFPDSRWLPKALDELAETYSAENMPSKAAELYERIADRYPDGASSEATTIALANSYIDAMRYASTEKEQLRYARKVIAFGGLDSDIVEEASFTEAKALLGTGGKKEKAGAAETLARLAENPQSLWGAKSAVTLGQWALDRGNPEKARVLMEEFTDSGSPHHYWVARGFIILADALRATGNNDLADEYLNSLRQNYPGDELDIHDMIARRLKQSGKDSKK